MEQQQILTILEALSAKIDALTKQESKDAYESSETKDLVDALAKAQGEYKRIGYNRDNPFFKSQYVDLDTVIQAITPAFTKYGLAFTQDTRFTPDGATILHTRIRHKSGQWIESRARILAPKADQQSYGSTLSYQKRYAAMALVGITASHDPVDDDAEIAMVETRDVQHKGVAINTKYNPKEQSHDTVTKEQLEELEYELSEYPDIAEMILNGLNLRALADLPKSKFLVSINRVREIKAVRNGVKTP